MNASHSRGFVKTLTKWLTYKTFLVKIFLNEHFYQGDNDGSQYVIKNIVDWIVAEVDASFVEGMTVLIEWVPLLTRISLFKRSLLMCFSFRN